MSKEFTGRRKGMFLPDYVKHAEELRTSAIELQMLEWEIDLLIFEAKIPKPEWRDKLSQFLQRVIDLTQPPPYGPREIADLIDANISFYLERHGLSLEQAVPLARKSVADALNKSFEAVKSAHVRYGKQGVAKPQNLPR